MPEFPRTLPLCVLLVTTISSLVLIIVLSANNFGRLNSMSIREQHSQREVYVSRHYVVATGYRGLYVGNFLEMAQLATTLTFLNRDAPYGQYNVFARQIPMFR